MRNGLLFVLVTTASLSSCATHTTYLYSKPVGLEPSGPFANARVSVGQTVDVFVHVTNALITETRDTVLFVPVRSPKFVSPLFSGYYRPEANKSTDHEKQFVVEILISSRMVPITFSPGLTCISLNQESPCMRPIEWLPPTAPFETDGRVGPLCRNAFTLNRNMHEKESALSSMQSEFNDFTALVENEPVLLKAGSSTCIVLKYPMVPPDPRHKFALRLGTIHVGTRPQMLPDIRYAQGIFKGRIFPGG